METADDDSRDRIAGEPRRRMLPLEAAFFATRRMPNADLHIFSNCGHWAQVERKSTFEALVWDFLTAA